MKEGRIFNQGQIINSLQVGYVQNVPAGDKEFGMVVLLKNLTEDPIEVQIRPAGQQDYITTVLASGWNPELVTGIKGATENTLQYGY